MEIVNLSFYLFIYFKVTRGMWDLVTPESNGNTAGRQEKYDVMQKNRIPTTPHPWVKRNKRCNARTT